jgi:hypothetical protein
MASASDIPINSTVPDSRRAMADRALQKLETLADIGLRLAAALERHVLCAEGVQVHQAKTDPDVMVMPACDLVGVGLSYSRISRAVRMTLALQNRLASPQPCSSLDRPAPPSQGADAPRPHPPTGDERTSGSCPRCENEALESLFDIDEAAILSAMPLGDIIAGICRDLALPAQQTQAVLADWAEVIDTLACETETVAKGTPRPPVRRDIAWLASAARHEAARRARSMENDTS